MRQGNEGQCQRGVTNRRAENCHQHQRQQEAADCSGIGEIIALECFVVHPDGQRPCRRGGVAHQGNDEIEGTQGIHGKDGNAAAHGTLELRNDELHVNPGHISAVQLGSVENVGGHILDGCQKDNRHITGKLPYHSNDDGQHDGLIGRCPHQVAVFHGSRHIHAQNAQKGIEHAAGGAIHIRPYRTCDHEGQGKGQQNQGAEHSGSPQSLIHQQRQAETQQQAQRNQAEQQQGVAQRRPEIGTGEHFCIVAEAAPAIAGFQHSVAPVGHGNPQVPAQGDINKVDEQCRRDANPNQRMMVKKGGNRCGHAGCKALCQLIAQDNSCKNPEANPELGIGKGHVAEIFKKFRYLFHRRTLHFF